ncbi:unnamed protein product [Brachionus calyciflorus]|uniref:WRKY domain-containing protein n=1 Tax=Brachionus calyciflorus TaxID=104777 RepID=A0A813VX49_9BILA|nr:unnamed protein product [Brachionus calyciflorus]
MSDSETSSTSLLEPVNGLEQGQDTDEDCEELVVDSKKTRGKAKEYKEYQSFSNYSEALYAINDELDKIQDTTWAKKNLKVGKGAKSDKQFFKCSKCNIMLYIERPKTNSRVIIFIQDEPHNHETKKGIPDKTKQIIYTMYFEQKQQPKKIQRWLREHLDDGHVEVNSVQLNNLIQNEKKKEMIVLNWI